MPAPVCSTHTPPHSRRFFAPVGITIITIITRIELLAYAVRNTRSKSSTYATVLEALDAQLALPGFAHVRQQLAPVVEPCRSSVFEQIIF